MTAHELLEHFATLGVTVTHRNGRLHVDAPAGVLTPALRQSLSDHKPEMLQLLAQPKRRSNSSCPRCNEVGERALEVINALRPNLPRALQGLPDEKLLWLAAWSLMVSFERSLRQVSS